MKKQPLFVLAMVVTVLAVLPISVRGDSLMHVGIGRGMRTGPGKDPFGHYAGQDHQGCVSPHPVHARPAAGRLDRHADL